MFVAGNVVRCTAGREKDRFYLVIEVRNGQAAIADGKTRKLAAPKWKNTKHLAATNHKLELAAVPTDRKLRCALAPLNQDSAGPETGEGG